jgi:hypothetical protein
MWEARMGRLIQEIEWEFTHRLVGRPSGIWKRQQRDVLERGYELTLDLHQRSVSAARELGEKEWNQRRLAAGLSPIC